MTCIVLVPYLAWVEEACERELRALEARGLEVRRFAATAAIDRTRSEAATTALRDGADELVWISGAFEAGAIEALRARDAAIAVGEGCVLVRRVVYLDIARTYALPTCNVRFGAPVVPYYLPMVVAGEYLDADAAFFERARAAGHRW